MALDRIVFLVISTIATIVLIILRRKLYPEVAVWKMVIMGCYQTIIGVLAAMIMGYIEFGEFGGTKYYGVVLFGPIMILPELLLGLSYKTIMNMCAPGAALVLGIMKADCYVNGCCMGRYLPSLGFQFPSQIVEGITCLVVMAILLWIERRNRRTPLYAWYLVIFGSTRFVLNWFRYIPKPWKWILPHDIIWSILSVVIGIVWLLVSRAKEPAAKQGQRI